MDEKIELSPEKIGKILKTPQGKQLLSILQSADPRLLQGAMEAAKAGDTQKAAAMLSPLTNQQDIQSLIESLKGGR